ncbi:MAG: tetratricopeptide repeat protein [Lachnospiraceae bacterium]|nr:tetratricopeptide repeat protein [Lachnospiraceae bacterium]
MNCYNCGCRLSEKNFCTSCGADVAVYKKIIHISNRFYNDGLEKANVRDLSGAIISLRQSLKFNKNSIKARNLLGLVYFESGEVVAALSEWVISKNIRAEKNVADDYINAIQANPTRLDTINQTIKKYNQALVYCCQDSLDLAVIQLKKVLSLNPKFVRAHQLLALIYIKSEELEKARRELEKCLAVDANNTTTLRYLKEINSVSALDGDRGQSAKEKRKSSEDVIRYQSGNETIIQPMNVKEQTGFSSIFNIIIGGVIGLAVACFLILPARISAAKVDMNAELKSVSEQSDVKSSTIAELQQQVKTLTSSNGELKNQVSSYEGDSGTLQAGNNLIKAAQLYIADPSKVEDIANVLANIDMENNGENISREFQSLYTTLMDDIGPKVSATYYSTGYAAYKKGDYANAITDLTKAFDFDNTNIEALYNLGNSYDKNGDTANAQKTYAKLIELFPDTERAKRAEANIAQLNAQDEEQ